MKKNNTISISNIIVLFTDKDYKPMSAKIGGIETKRGFAVLGEVPEDGWSEPTATKDGGWWFKTTNDWDAEVAFTEAGYTTIMSIEDTGRKHEKAAGLNLPRATVNASIDA